MSKVYFVPKVVKMWKGAFKTEPPMPFAVDIIGLGVGYMPVYESLNEMQKDFPDVPFEIIRIVEDSDVSCAGEESSPE